MSVTHGRDFHLPTLHVAIARDGAIVPRACYLDEPSARMTWICNIDPR
jgi:hypothetical protein